MQKNIIQNINYSNFKKLVSETSKIMNKIACFGIVAAMAVVALNVLLRSVFKSPIIGTHEYMCFLTTIAVGCSIAYCALSDGHISIDFIVEKLKGRTQKIIGIFTQAISFFLTVPIFYPVAVNLGYDPIWFGVIIVLVVAMGVITPPVGMNVFIIKGVAPDILIEKIYKGIWPFLIALFVCLVILIIFPQIVTFLPELLM